MSPDWSAASKRLALIVIATVALLGCPPKRPVTVCPVPTAQPERATQLNPRWDRLDENGVPLSPQWVVQASKTGEPLCLTDPDAKDVCGKFPRSGGVPKGRPPCNALAREEWPATDVAHAFICGLGRGLDYFPGHLNYLPATYHGLIWFENHSWPDDDLDFDMLPVERESGAWKLRRGGLTTQRRLMKGLITDGALESALRTKGLDYVLHVEAKASETVDQFGQEWWAKFRSASKEARKEMVRDRPAVATGLLGLDAEHGAFTEIHPTHAVAIQTSCGTPDSSHQGAYLDTWSFFVRNHGNEGWCAEWSLQHMLDPVSDVFTLALPTAFSGEVANAELVAAGTTVLSNKAGVERSPLELANGRFLVRFRWPAGLGDDEWLRIHGELNVRWWPQQGKTAQCLDLKTALSQSPEDPVAASRRPGPPEEREDNAEHFLRQLYGERPPELAARAAAALDSNVVTEANVPAVDLGAGKGPCPGDAGSCDPKLRAVLADRTATPRLVEAAELRSARPEICALAETARDRPGIDRKRLEALLKECRAQR